MWSSERPLVGAGLLEDDQDARKLHELKRRQARELAPEQVDPELLLRIGIRNELPPRALIL
jgi:hypothetical protein